jgi:hypothetical protein
MPEVQIVAGLYYGKNDEEALLYMQTYINRLHEDAYDGGLFVYLRNLQVIFKEREEQDDKRHKSNSLKLNFLLVIATLIGVIVSAFIGWATIALAHRSSVDPFNIFGPDKQSLTYADDRPSTDAHSNPRY